MRTAALAAVVLIAGGLLAAGTLRRAGTNAGPPNNTPLAVTGVTVVKGNGEAPVAGQTILIENGRFVQIFPDGQSPIPAHYEIVPASGRFCRARAHRCARSSGNGPERA